MRSINPFVLLFLSCLLLSIIGSAQDTLSITKRLWNEFYSEFDTSIFSLQERNIIEINPDSTVRKKLLQAIALPDSSFLEKNLLSFRTPALSFSSKPFLKIGNGYVSYNWTYRSGNDSSFIDNNVSQHLVTASFNATIAQAIPIRVTYLERQSNSPFFKDFRDISVDIDVQKYRQLKMQRALANLKNRYESFNDPLLPYAMNAVNQKLDQYKGILNSPGIIRELIRSKETLIRTDFSDTAMRYIDSVKNKAKRFIGFYDTLKLKQGRYQQIHDSLYLIYDKLQQKIKKASKFLNSKSLSASEIRQLAELYGDNDKDIQELHKTYNGLRRLSVGRTLPSFTNLTLKNVNVNGFNLEYTKGKYYLAAAAGLVDFRIRDFLYSQQKPPRQYVYSARAGYGAPAADHIILTYFRGRKQLFGGNLQRPSADIQGVSLEGQIFINRNIRLYSEVAQSGIPYALGGNNSSKPVIALNDHSQRAYAFGFASSFPHMKTMVEGYYQHTGLNYQSFNSFQYNAASNSWSLRLEQFIWKRQLSLQASFQKNDFVNPIVLQRYNANTVFKNLSATFRKQKWPVISIGYIPASQFTVVGSQVYENHYQSFTGNISHQYDLGIARGTTLFSFSRFFNDNDDSALVYYNAKNFFVSQTFLFNRFTATINISGMDNGIHQLIVMEEGLSATFLKRINAAFAIKINNLDRSTNKIGFNARTRVMLKKLGDLNIWMEQSYLPALHQGFYKYEVYNIGFIRYFN